MAAASCGVGWGEACRMGLQPLLMALRARGEAMGGRDGEPEGGVRDATREDIRKLMTV